MGADPFSVRQDIIIYSERSNGDDLPENFMTEYHMHLFCHSGRLILSHDGQGMSCKSGEFVFCEADGPTRWVESSKGFKASILLVENQFLLDNVPDPNWGVDATLHSRRYPIKVIDSAIDRKRILYNFRRLDELYQDKSHHFYEEIVRLQMRSFILEMWHTFANEYQRRKRSLLSGSLYERFIHLVETQCTTRREVQYYADELNISAKYLNYICKQNSNITASEWIQLYAKDRLAALLQNHQMNIAEIADEMEFSSRSFFTRYVKRLLGVTPTEYRSRL